MSNAKLDENRQKTIIGVSSIDLATPTLPRVNPSTGALIAEVTAVSYAATSTTSLAIGTGSKVFTTQAGKPYLVGTRLRASSGADPADYMEGVVTAYSGTSLTINVDNTGGTGTDADWNINLAGDVGDTGATGATGDTGATGPAGAGRRSATLVIAASDSKDTDVASSDYQCDGTADEVQINAAIAALPAGGGRIVLLEGTFNISAAINIAKSNVTLEGQGTSTIIALGNSLNVNCINVGAGATVYSHIAVKNLKIDGNMANQTTDGHGININSGVSYGVVEECWITNTYKSSIISNGSYANLLNNNTETNTSLELISIYGSYTLCEGNICTGGVGAYIYIRSGVGATLIDNICVVSNNPTNGVINIDSDRSTCENNFINVVSGNSAIVTGIIINKSNITVSNNYINFDTNFGHIGMSTFSNSLIISKNFISGYYGAVGAIAFDGTTCTGSIISQNIFTNFETAMNLTGSTTLTVTSNYADGNITITNVENSTVSGNNFALCTFTSVNTTRRNGLTIVGNYFNLCSLSLQGIGYSTIQGNTIKANTESVILITSSGTAYSIYNNISGNVIYRLTGTSTNGIIENSVNNGPNIITNNIVKNCTNPIVTAHTSTDVSHNITT